MKYVVKQIFTRHDSVGELSAVFEAFYQQEQQAAQDRKPHVALVFGKVFEHQRSPGHDHGDARADEDHRVKGGKRNIEER